MRNDDDTTDTTPRLLWPTSEAAAAVSLKPQTLRAMRSRGDGPTFVRLSKNTVAYTPEDLKSWIESRKRKSTADPGPGRAA